MSDQTTWPDFELVPADDDLTPDEELALLSDPDDFVLAPDQEDQPLPFGKSIWIDLDDRPGHPPTVVHGIDSFVVWATVALKTKMGTWEIFPDDFGMEDPDRLVGHPDDTERRAEYMRDVRQTLRQYDRVTNVGNFQWELDDTGEVVEVSIEVELDGDELVLLEVPVGSH